jgi:hypothetical protein
MDDLLQQADELGIKVDKRWSEKRLQQEIDTALGAPAQEAEEVAEKSFPVKLNKNYRPVGPFKIERTTEGVTELVDPDEVEILKVPAGTVIHVSVEEARDIIAKKVADRNDPIG